MFAHTIHHVCTLQAMAAENYSGAERKRVVFFPTKMLHFKAQNCPSTHANKENEFGDAEDQLDAN